MEEVVFTNGGNSEITQTQDPPFEVLCLKWLYELVI